MDQPAAQIKQGPGEGWVAAQVPGRNRRKYIGWTVLVAYSLLLGYRSLYHDAGSGIAGIGLWELHDSRRLLAWIGGLVLTALYQCAYFIPIGFVAAVLVPRGRGRWRRFWVRLCALSMAGTVAVLICVVELVGSGRQAVVLGLVFPLLGCGLGTWMGATWRRGRRACLWFLPKVVLSIILAAVCLGILIGLSLDRTPLPFEAAPVTSAEKRRLVDLFRDKNPVSLEDGRICTLWLTEHDLNVLLSWGLSLGSPAQKASVGLAPGSASLAASVRVPLGAERCRYLNLELAGGVGVEKGVLRLDMDRGRLGGIEVPRRLLGWLSRIVAAQIRLDRRWKPFLEATQEMRIEPKLVRLAYGCVRLPPELRRELLGPTAANEETLASTRAQIDHFLAVVKPLPPSQLTFGLCFETVFALARERSAQRDPVMENRAGIFALGILLGHPRIKEFLGWARAERDEDAARLALARVVLRGRSDWTKHFCVSAVIAVLSDEAVSGAAGLLKEELDADTGGSGFSFSDLLADRAGTTFAIRATCDEAAARAMQARLAGGFRVDDFFPPAADLPEGIPDAQFQSQYGGVGGERYLRLIEEIERRVTGCAAYR
ncbi:MAG: hypothetical protein NTZ17_00680 [Phycisphaerae bacterium]|nr:hypothetical protein [Phycisphaerae bacterium]